MKNCENNLQDKISRNQQKTPTMTTKITPRRTWRHFNIELKPETIQNKQNFCKKWSSLYTRLYVFYNGITSSSDLYRNPVCRNYKTDTSKSWNCMTAIGGCPTQSDIWTLAY